MLPVPFKYALMQLPAIGAVGGIAWFLHASELISLASAWGIVAVWIAKDLGMYPLLRRAYGYEPGSMVGPERLLGAQARAEDDLAPSGYVRLRGELWRAEAVPGSAPIARGSAVRVEAVHDLTLRVRETSPDSRSC